MSAAPKAQNEIKSIKGKENLSVAVYLKLHQ
jgi:hypothetical protein